MQIETTLRKQDMAEICTAMFPRKAAVFVHCAAAVFAVLALTTPLRKNFSTSIVLSVIYLAGGILMEHFLRQRKKELLNIALKRWEELYSEDTLQYQYDFGENAVRVCNTSTGGEATMKYEIFKKYKETEHFALLITKSDQWLAVEKEIARENHLHDLFKTIS